MQRLNGLDQPKPHDQGEMAQYAQGLEQSLENVNWKLKIKNKKGERVAVPTEIKLHFDTMASVATRFRAKVDGAAGPALAAAASDLAASDVFLAGDRALQKFHAETCA